MNKAKWSDSAMPLSRLVIKLGEESGEVAKEFSDFWDVVGRDRPIKLNNVIKECDHVIFIAEQAKERALAELTTRMY